MTKDLKTIDLNSLPIESVTVQLRELFDDCEQTLRVVESIPPDEWKRVQNFGRMLARARQLTPHGEWTDYITDTFAGRLTMRVAQRIVAAELNPDGAEKRKEKDRKRKAAKSNTTESEIPSHLKTSGVVVTNPDKPAKEKDPDPAPNPPTNRKTATGSEKPSEESKPRTQTVVPEILDDESADEIQRHFDETINEWLAVSSANDIYTRWVELGRFDGNVKHAAKQLRKLADKLDPPKQVIPTVEEVADYAEQNGWKTFDAAKFWNHYELAKWKYGKGKTPLTNWHIAASQAWDSGNGWASSNGKANNGTGSTTNLGSNGRPPVPRSKINYK